MKGNFFFLLLFLAALSAPNKDANATGTGFRMKNSLSF
jgi:hypothetical protein